MKAKRHIIVGYPKATAKAGGDQPLVLLPDIPITSLGWQHLLAQEVNYAQRLSSEAP
jgi:hypothetical protein